MELLLGPPPNGWKPIRPTVEGAYEVWLGGLLRRLPVVRGGVSVSETWSCVDSTILDCDQNWAEIAGSAWGITTNAAQRAGLSAWNEARADADLATDAHEVQVTLVALTTGILGTVAGAVLARKDATVTRTFYFWEGVVDHAGTNEHRLAKRVAGTETVLQTLTNDFTAGEVIKLRCDGSTIKGFLAGVEISSVTDTAITGNLRCGIAGYGDALGSNVHVDTWSAADLAAAAAVRGHGALLSGLRNQVIQRV